MQGRRLALAVMAVSALAAAGCSSTDADSTPARPARASKAARRPFDRAVVIMFENKSPGEVLGNGSAPTFNALARRYAVLRDYGTLAHKSLPNYLAIVSGSTHGITKDCTDCVVDAPNLADSLEAKHRTWKTYAEDLPSPGFTGAKSGRYAKKHDPLIYFRDIASSPSRRDNVVPYTQLAGDLSARRLPDFALVVPNLCDDMHDCPVSTGDAWLKRNLPSILASPQMRRGVVFVIFDEGNGSAPGRPGGLVPALAVGPTVKRGARTRGALSHYSLLRTIEDAFGLPRLGASAQAAPIRGIWR